MCRLLHTLGNIADYLPTGQSFVWATLLIFDDLRAALPMLIGNVRGFLSAC